MHPELASTELRALLHFNFFLSTCQIGLATIFSSRKRSPLTLNMQIFLQQ